MTILSILAPVLVGKSIRVYTYKNLTGRITKTTSNTYGAWIPVSSELLKIVSISNDEEYEGDNLCLHFSASHIYLSLDKVFELE